MRPKLLSGALYFCVSTLLFGLAGEAYSQGTAFTYQGRLNSGGAPASGSYDLTFTLFNADSGGSAIAGPVTNTATTVSNGLFTATLDFGPAAFTGAGNWLEIAVQPHGGSGFTTLAPRQSLTPTPYAIYSANAATATSAGSVSAANITGTIPLAQLPTSVVTNGASGVSISGTFTGNGVGITGVAINSLQQLQSQGTVVAWGDNAGGKTTIPAGLTNVGAIAAGQFFSVALQGQWIPAQVALRAGGNTFTGNQFITSGSVGIGTNSTAGTLTLNGTFYQNSPGNPGTTAIIRARPGDNLPFAVQTANAVNVLLVNANNQTTFSDGNLQFAVEPGTLFGQPNSSACTLDIVGLNGTLGVWDNLSVFGTVSQSSDRNQKENFTSVDPRAVLEKVVALPLTEWNYKRDAAGQKHLGPMAQDFHAAFGLNGTDDKTITTVDESGVALAAIQGLNTKLSDELRAVRAENDELKARLDSLEKLLTKKQMDGAQISR